ncbi:MAG: glycosyltransferase, partial [Chloroflexota bacterium]
MLNVVHIIDSINVGGAQRLLFTLAQATRGMPLAMRVVSLRHDTDSPIPDQLASLGVEVVYFPAKRMLSPNRLRRLGGWLRHERPNLVHTHLTYANIVGTMAAKAMGIPVVSTLHNIRPRKQGRVALALEARVLQWGAQQIIAVGQAVADAYRQRLAGCFIAIIPNAVAIHRPLELAEIESLRLEVSGSADRPLLVAVGRLTPQKGFEDLLDAFALVCRDYPEAYLVIAGSGELMPELVNQIQALNLERNTRLLGQWQDVEKLLAAADLYVSSSRWEGLSVATLEAMAAGVAVVATAVGETPEILTGEMGILVPPNDPENLAEALANLLADPNKRRDLGSKARQHVIAHYEASAWAERILALYGA